MCGDTEKSDPKLSSRTRVLHVPRLTKRQQGRRALTHSAQAAGPAWTAESGPLQPLPVPCTSVSHSGLPAGVTRHVAKGQPCSSVGLQTLTRKPPLGAWTEGRAPDHLLGPLLGDSFDSGIRGPGSGVNSICLGSIQTVRGSVLPAITNFLNKSQAKGAQGRLVRPGDAWALWDIPTVSSAHVTRIPPSDNSGRGTEGGSTLQMGKPRLRTGEGAHEEALPSGQADRGPQLNGGGPNAQCTQAQGGGGGRSSQWTKAGRPACGGAFRSSASVPLESTLDRPE